jgi:hypothetical protein
MESSPSDNVINQINANGVSLPEVSVVMPCLNEADTLATCIENATRALNEYLCHRFGAASGGCQPMATDQFLGPWTTVTRCVWLFLAPP